MAAPVLKTVGLSIACGACAVSSFAAQADIANLVRKQAVAVRISGDVIHIDGRLTEQAWADAHPIQDFIQQEPNEGADPSEQTEVRILYDDSGLFVGARMYHRGPDRIQAPLGRRDRAEQAEHIYVALDTFLDHRTAYMFGITATGVRLDR